MKWFLQRLAEPSSYAGLAAAIAAVQQLVSGQWQTALPALLGGITAFALPEKPAA
jgi:hypothetical protein